MRRLLTVVAVLAAVASCASKAKPAPGTSTTVGDAAAAPPAGVDPRTPGTPVRAGSMRDAHVADGYAVVVPAGGDVAATEAAMRAAGRAAPKGIEVRVSRGTVEDVRSAIDLVRYFGRGLDADDLAGLRAATDVVEVA
ncbi:MAG TPA: hypothetical protein VHE35_21835, partial [Kofleriaceae bacterium]|nr:hypothetical protein [Kofleriaceae bacterium]